MRILISIHHELNPNAGAPGSILKLAECYRSSSNDVEIFSFESLPKVIQKLKLEGYLFPLFLANKLCKDSYRFDVIDASSGDIWLWGSVFKRFSKFGGICVTHSHGLEHTMNAQILEEGKNGNLNLSWKYPIYHGGFRLWEVAKSMQCADLVMMLNHEDLNFAINHIGLSPNKVRVVHNGIPDFMIGLPIDFSQDIIGEIKIAQIGSYINRKGIKYGNPALNNILQKYPNVKLTFFGTGCSGFQVINDFSPMVRHQVSVIQNFDHVNLPSLLNGYHIKLFPTLSEGFSLALLEAMACGLLPIATDIPGSREILKADQNSIIVPPRSQIEIEKALEKVISNTKYLNELRRNAYSTAQSFSWACVANERVKLYEDYLEASDF